MKILNREFFFKQVRALFGSLTQEKVDAFNFLLEAFETSKVFNTKAKIAYALATIKRETAETFRPVVEGYWMTNNRVTKLYNYYRRNNPGALSTIFPNGINGKAYYGRGYTQLTHNFNYNAMGNALGIDLLSRPDEALDKRVAFNVLEVGVYKGSFTGKRLSNYFDDSDSDDVNDYRFGKWQKPNGGLDSPRKMINGLDAATEIGDNAVKFFTCLQWQEVEDDVQAESINGTDVQVETEPKPAEVSE